MPLQYSKKITVSLFSTDVTHEYIITHNPTVSDILIHKQIISKRGDNGNNCIVRMTNRLFSVKHGFITILCVYWFPTYKKI